MTIKRFHTTMALGDKRHMTPEGFLVCLDVPMARTGEMLYGPNETPVHSADGVSGVTIRRDEDEVFAPDTILSIIGKPVTNDHPDENVTPENWSDNAVGHVVSARRGTGVNADILLGDIMVTQPDAIRDILAGKREVSCGYDADYEELQPGMGRQKNIYYNHLALVDKGRCGPRCAIGDYLPPELQTGDVTMAKGTKRIIVNDKRTLVARLAGLIKGGSVKDADIENAIEEETADEVSSEGGPSDMGSVHIHMSGGPGGGTNSKAAGGNDDLTGNDPDPAAAGAQPKPLDPAIEARFQGIESALQQIAAAVQKIAGGGDPEPAEGGAPVPPADELAEEAPADIGADAITGAKDSAFMQDSWTETVATAEIIAPGVRVPTFDSAAKPGLMYKALCGFRRKVLHLAYAVPKTQNMLDEIVGGRTFDASEKCMTCDKVRNTFRSLGLLARAHNNDHGRTEHRVPGSGGAVAQTGQIKSIAELNAFNANRHKKNKVA